MGDSDERRGQENWDKFDADPPAARKASLLSAPGNLGGEAEEIANPEFAGSVRQQDSTLLNGNGYAPKRRVSGYGLQQGGGIVEAVMTSIPNRKRSIQPTIDTSHTKSRKESTITNASMQNSSSNYGLALVPEDKCRRMVPKDGSNSLQREQWGRKLEFLLSVIGFAVDLGNVWRFPYICYRNGGVNGRGDFEKKRLYSDDGSVVTDATDTGREGWSHKFEFLLSVIGFAVDLGNVWRFPYICFRNGGGAFLIPYFLMIVFGGIPLFYLELVLGQYHRSGCISIWRKICPLFKGVGYAICLIALFVSSYYNTIIAWAVYYLYSSFASELPWAHCNHTWTDSNCVDQISSAANNLTWSNTSESPAHQFFERHVLEMHKSKGINDLGVPRWELVICLFIVYVCLYFCLWKGVRSSGKAVWVTATFPYVVLFILLIRGAMLPGASMGIEYYLRPKWHLLLKPSVWLEAATQVFFSLGPGFGTLIALSSYNRFHNNCYRDAFITSVINCATSFMAGFVVFSVMGYMAHILHKTNIEDVTTPGMGLLFVVYGQALTTFGGSVFFSIMFFLMIITLGLDSSFGGLEAVITGFSDEYPELIGKHREKFVLGFLCLSFCLALSTTTYGGIYLITLLETYATGAAIMTVVLLEAISVSWFYGIDRLSGDIKAMIGFGPGMYWTLCWKYISPIFLGFMIIMGIVFTTNLEYDGYKYPNWSTALGWMITLSSMSIIPGYAIYRFLREPGSPKQRLFVLLRPEVGGHAQPRESLAMTSPA